MAARLDDVDPVTPQLRRSTSLRDILSVLFCQRLTIISVFSALFGLTLAATFLSPTVYQSEAKILLRIGRESVSVDPTVVGPTIGLSRSRENEINSEISILASRHVIEQVVDTLGPSVVLGERAARAGASDHRQRLAAIGVIERNLAAEAERKSNNISIRLRARHADLAQRLLEEILRAYERRHIEVYQTQASLEFFQQRVDRLHDEIETKETALAAFQRRFGIAAPQRQKEDLIKQVTDMQDRSDAIQRLMLSLHARRGALIDQLMHRDPYEVTSRVVGMVNPAADGMKARLVVLRARAAELRSEYPEGSNARQSQLAPIEESIRLTEAALAEEEDTREEVTTSIDSGYQELVRSMQRTSIEINELSAEQSAIGFVLSERREELADFVERERELSNRLRDIAYDREEYGQYREGLQRSKVASALDTDQVSNVSVVQPATLPIAPISPNKPRNLALGLLLSVTGSLGLAFVMERFDDTVKSAADVADHLNLVVLTDISIGEFEQCS